MKFLLSVISIAMVLFLSSCNDTNKKDQGQKDPQSKTTRPKEQTPPNRVAPAAGVRTAVVREVIHTTSYTYLKVKEDAAELWLAIPKKDVTVGETITFKEPMPMANFKSKELNRTFETVYFLGGIGGDPATSGQKQPVKPTAGKRIEGSIIKLEGVHTAVVMEVIEAGSYMYLKLKEADIEFWAAISKRPMTVGETVSFEKPMDMREFYSKQLKTTFGVIYFLSEITKDSDSGGKEPAVDSTKPTVVKKPAGKTTVEPAKGGLTIGKLFDNRDSYSGKVVRIRGKVVKFSKSIMGKNWVHLQDGTGGTGTNDLLVTTQEIVAIGDVVEFEGTVTLNKNFGSGYKYEVLMEKGIKK